MKKLSLDEIKNEELTMLKKLASFLDKNNLKYFLCGGTLLGAVRHKGFIPWDDDIDIFMPREDYEEFQRISGDFSVSSNYDVVSIEKGNLDYPFCKIINKKIEINSKSLFDRNLWIDIFPLDGFSDNYNESVKTTRKVSTLKGIIYLHTTSFKSIVHEHRSVLNRIVKVILKPICIFIPVRFCSKIIRKTATKYSYNDSNYVGGIVWGYGICERFKKDSFAKSIELEFEGTKFHCPKDYDEILSSIYGDYMKLPPAESRKTHEIIAVRLD